MTWGRLGKSDGGVRARKTNHKIKQEYERYKIADKTNHER